MGNGFNFFLQLIFTPIISRIFSPDAYGEYGLYNLIVTNVVFYGAMSLPSVFLIPKQREDFLQLGITSLYGAIILTIPVITVISIGDFFKIDIGIMSILLIVTLIILTSFNSILTSWNARSKQFLRNTKNDSISNIASKSFCVLIGKFAFADGNVLLMGDFIRAIITSFFKVKVRYLLVIIRRVIKLDVRKIRRVISAYKATIRYNFPSQAFTKLTGDIPILVIGVYFGKSVLGSYIFAVSILSILIKLIDNSIRPVLFQKAVEVYNENPNDLGSFFYRSFRVTPLLSVVPLFILDVSAAFIFPFLFGEEWYVAAQLVPILFVDFACLMIINPYVDFWRLLKKEKELLRLNIFTLLIRLSPFVLVFFTVTFETLLIVFSVLSAVSRLVLVDNLLRKLVSKKVRTYTIAILFSVVGFLYILGITISY